jgi:hypothetical protein
MSQQTGRNLSFMDAYIYSADGKELLAQGNHVKFMVNHPLTNTLTHMNSIVRPWMCQQMLDWLVTPRVKKAGGILSGEYCLWGREACDKVLDVC